MKPLEPNEDKQWEDLIRRLGGTPEQAHAQPVQEPPTSHQEESPEDSPAGPRDYQVADEIVEDFQPPEPQPIASRSPRAVLSWFGVIGALAVWILAAVLRWPLPWWLATVTLVGLLGGAVSLFFLLPKSWAHRDPFDDENYGGGAKL